MSIIPTTTLDPAFDFRYFAHRLHSHMKFGNGEPYSVHLDAVEQVLADFGYTGLFWQVSGQWHDLVEDCGVTREMVQRLAGEDVDATVWACTGNGENRRARNDDIREKVLVDWRGGIVKAADRITHLEFSIRDQSTKYASMYLKEEDRFMETMILAGVPHVMLERLQRGYDGCREVMKAAA